MSIHIARYVCERRDSNEDGGRKARREHVAQRFGRELGESPLAVYQPLRLNCVSIVFRTFCMRWKRFAT